MYDRVFAWFHAQAWAIMPEKLEAMAEFAAAKFAGMDFSAEEIEARIGAQHAAAMPRAGGGAVAVIPVHGVISHRMNMFSAISGGSSTEMLSKSLRSAIADPDVSAIVFDIDSPGGAVAGLQEFADEIYQARGRKRMVAVANTLAASAAYFIASAADEIVVTPSGDVGSIGTVVAHVDVSGAEEQAGIKTTLISAGKYKTEANPYEPLGDDAKAAIQKRIDEHYGSFVEAVARNRGVSKADVTEGYGEGRVVGAREAVRIGMADRIDTLDNVIAGLVERRPASRRARAALAMAQRT